MEDTRVAIGMRLMEDKHNVLSATLDSPCTDKVGVQPKPVASVTRLDTRDVVVVHSS